MPNDMLIEVFGDQSVSPLPVALRSGELVRGFRIVGADPDTGALGEGIDAQLRFAHEHMRRSIESVGGSRANIAQVSMYFQDFARDREAMNPPWVDAFPDDDDRPTYKFLTADLPGDLLVYMDYHAVLGHSRQVLNVEGVAHTNPIPLGVRMGPVPLLLPHPALRPVDGPPAGGRAGSGRAPVPQRGGPAAHRRHGLEQRQAGSRLRRRPRQPAVGGGPLGAALPG